MKFYLNINIIRCRSNDNPLFVRYLGNWSDTTDITLSQNNRTRKVTYLWSIYFHFITLTFLPTPKIINLISSRLSQTVGLS